MVRVVLALVLAVLVAPGPAGVRGGVALGAQAGSGEKAKSKKAKKVWTNEDLERLREGSPISVMGGAAAKGAGAEAAGGGEKAEAGGAPYIKAKDPQWYRQRMGSLRAELEKIESEISHLRKFVENPYTGQAGLSVNQENGRLSPANQIELLERRRNEVRRQMDDLEDEARRNGIPSGVLR
jgi:hypothetical protein